MQIMTWAIVVVAGLGLAYATALTLGAWRWSGSIRDMLAQLDSSQLAPATRSYHESELTDMPAPVQRYFSRSSDRWPADCYSSDADPKRPVQHECHRW